MGQRQVQLIWVAILLVLVFLNLIPFVGFLRAMPVPDGQGGARPFGSLFPGTLLFTDVIRNGEVIDQSMWAAERYLAGENVYDFKEWYVGNWFTYFPTMLFAALVLMPFQPFQYYPWLLLIFAALACVAVIADRILKEKGVKQKERWIVIGLLLLGQSVVRNAGWGHYFLLVLACLFLIYYFLDKREIVAGFAAALLNAILPYGYILVAYFIIKRRWKALTLSLVLPLLPFVALFVTNKASFYGFFAFFMKAGLFGLSKHGSFAIIRLVEGTPWKFVYLGLQALLFAALTIGLWCSTRSWNMSSRGTPRAPKVYVTDEIYFAFIPLFLLLNEPWFSGHHIMLAMVPYVLLYSRVMFLPYLFTELNYQTLLGQRLFNGTVIYTIPMFFGVAIAYVLVLRVAYVRWRTALSRTAGKISRQKRPS